MEAVEQIKESKSLVIAIMAIFISGILLGVLAYPLLKEQVSNFASTLKSMIIGDSNLETALRILAKNIEASLITLILGPTILLPALVVFTNGFATGLIMHM
ncbi:MAG: stage II sporulation protein M, partial [Candidatus Altiarchaeota archaeon]